MEFFVDWRKQLCCEDFLQQFESRMFQSGNWN